MARRNKATIPTANRHWEKQGLATTNRSAAVSAGLSLTPIKRIRRSCWLCLFVAEAGLSVDLTHRKLQGESIMAYANEITSLNPFIIRHTQPPQLARNSCRLLYPLELRDF